MRRPVSRSHAAILTVTGLLVSAAMCALATRGVEPVVTWLYPFAWYPLLLALEGGIALRHGRFLLLHDRTLLLSVVGWSVPLWMLWEILNFRIENWYYVFVPERRVALWTGVVLSFGTVLPACFLPAALLWPRSASAPGDGDRSSERTERSPERDPSPGRDGSSAIPPRGLSSTALTCIRLLGLAMLVLPLLWPRIFFPLIWGGFLLLVEPDLYRRAPARSLLADALGGRLRRLAALLAGGALAGLTWEAFNSLARGKWIYSVPGLEEIKLFEMPVLGFLGFPPLALSCHALYQWIALRGWAPPLTLNPAGWSSAGTSTSPNPSPPNPSRPKSSPSESSSSESDLSNGSPASPEDPGEDAGWGERSDAPFGEKREPRSGRGGTTPRLAAVALVILTLLGMDAWTIASRTPRLRDLPELLPSDVEALQVWGIDSPFALAARTPERLVAEIPAVGTSEARTWIDVARLATLRGLGTRNARILHRWGIDSPEDLARSDPALLASCFRSSGAPADDVRPAEVRVWWREARRESGIGDSSESARSASPCPPSS